MVSKKSRTVVREQKHRRLRNRFSGTAERPIVTYLVIDAIFFLPSSPSFCISSNLGIAIVRSCIMIEDVIYGVMLSAKRDILSNEPPVKALR